MIETLRARGVPVILTTGYEAPDLQGMGLSEPMIHKPYRRHVAAAALMSLRPDRKPDLPS